MRIALLHPTYWPEVRRGSERLLHDLGATLAGRGHEVTLLTTHPGARAIAVEDGITVDRARRLPQRGPLNWYEHHVTTAIPAFTRLVRGEFDLAHAFFPVEAWAAIRARPFGGPPVIASAHGILTREWLVKRRYRLELMLAAAARAERVSVLSTAAAGPYARYLGREPDVLPGGVNIAEFANAEAPADHPTLLCAASLGDPRKRGPLLFEAFELLRRKVPDARLLAVRTPDPVLSAPVGRLPEGAEWVDGDRTDALARLYAGARASVLPSVEEAFGLVLCESLAAGTPVAAARSGACPEIVDDPRLGRLFEPDDPADLARAMAEALELGSDPATAGACRAAAERHDWARVCDRYERVYEEVTRSA